MKGTAKIKEQEYEMAALSMSSKVYNNEISGKHDRDINILIHAAKKQIGKKVARNEKYGSYRCPCCDAVIHRSQHYCSQCGQKFDWSNISINRYWYSEKQKEIGRILRPFHVRRVLVDDEWREYTEWTTSPNGKCNWDDAVLLAESETELPLMIDGVLQTRTEE